MASLRMRAVANALRFAFIVLVMLLALRLIAAQVTAFHLRTTAQQQLAAIKANQPLWQWRLREPRDLIAGHAFGHAQVVQAGDTLRVTSLDGTSFELGLPVAWSLDLGHWPILQLQMETTATGTLGLLWQPIGAAPTCVASTATWLEPGTKKIQLDLRHLDWQEADGTRCRPIGVAQMLRLRIQVPAKGAIVLREAALLTAQPFDHDRRLDLVDLPSDPATQQQAIGHAINNPELSPSPVIRLPAYSSAGTMLALRDALREHWPAALIVPFGTTLQAKLPSARSSVVDWIVCVFYVFAALALSLRRIHAHARPLLEIAVCLIGPLWLIAGLNWGLHATALGIVAFIGGVMYAFIVEWRLRPRPWKWFGHRRAWLGALVPVPVTLLLLVVFSHGMQPIRPLHALTYLLWALLQQWLMLTVVMGRFEQALRNTTWAILVTAGLFALLHTPNGLLMQLCLVAELWWAWCFVRSRNLVPIAVAHATCALLVEAGLGGGLIRSLEVSARFFA
jgi:hypothetical protein